METLFNVDELETNPDYVEPNQKRKWNEAFKKKILDDYNKNDGLHYDGHCGSRKYCDVCEMKYCNGASDCLVALKRYCKRYRIEIDYNDFDFEKLLDKVR